jgi:F-type H+-transporting ATPase subunit alpha
VTAATWPMEEQVATIFAVGQGLMDDIPVEDIKRFEAEMIEHLRAMPSAALKSIKDTKTLDDDAAETLKNEINKFKSDQWSGGEIEGVKTKEEIQKAEAKQDSEQAGEAEAAEAS